MLLAENIRRLLASQPNLNSAARNVRFSVYSGRVIMTGTTVTQGERQLLHSAVGGLPGVSRVDDKVQVDLSR
jgi:osmotically-inducible protein OsmY